MDGEAADPVSTHDQPPHDPNLPFGISFGYNVVPAGPILFVTRLD